MVPKRGMKALRMTLQLALSVAAIAGTTIFVLDRLAGNHSTERKKPEREYRMRTPLDLSGFGLVMQNTPQWPPIATLDDIRRANTSVAENSIKEIDNRLSKPGVADLTQMSMLIHKALFLNSQGKPGPAYESMTKARAFVEKNETVATSALYQLIYMQGATSLRLGENENCIECRGESSCIFPIAKTAVHTNPRGSRTAIKHFTDYLEKFPNDLEARWLLNIGHMTLGEYPSGVDSRYVLPLDKFMKSEFDIGKFRDAGHLVGVNRMNQAGGAIMDDFDKDGLFDLILTCWDATTPMVYFHNNGDGTFEDRTKIAGLTDQLGGLVCYQGDYNNDGNPDIFIPRGAWLRAPIRPSLLRNNGNGTFSDVTVEAGLLDPVNSNGACWGDYDNDGFLDLFVACEAQTNRLYHNRGNGTFEEVAGSAGVAEDPSYFSKGATWIDYDNDDFPDLLVNHLRDRARLYHNRRDGTFEEVSTPMGVYGPWHGFSCWAFDYDNDGWLDLYATCYDRTLGDVVKGIIGEKSEMQFGQLLHNVRGKKFEDKTTEAGLDMVFGTMGSNFADLDNDGFLDFYLGTGEPDIATLIPNRMFKNVDGKRFSEITASAGTGHLQKGHGVAIGDWDRDGDADVFIETGGAIDGDRYHDVFFQNPGQGNNWLSVKLVGKKSNRSAIGARIKFVTSGNSPRTIYRHVSSGSSFGANPLEQMIGVAKAEKVATVEIHWPTSGTTQVLSDISVNQSIEITEMTPGYRKIETKPIPLPE